MSLTVAGGTTIEWADFTFNPWWGCEKVSPGCAHCYAETLSHRRGFYPVNGQGGLWGDGHGFRFFGDKHWDEPLRWARNAPAKLGRRPRVFCASMADVFEERQELDEHRVRLYDLILSTPELDWLVLTKRPEFAREWLADGENRRRIASEHAFHHEDGDAAWDHAQAEIARGPRNVWLGVSIENSRFAWRADVLREIPAAVRFISAEPLLGSLFDEPRAFSTVDGRKACDRCGAFMETNQWQCSRASCVGRGGRKPLDLTGIDWLIVGGESGPGARPFHLEHAREIIRACRSGCPACDEGYVALDGPAGRFHHDALICKRPAVFVKQIGAKPMTLGLTDDPTPLYGLRDPKGGDPSRWPADLRIREFPRAA